MSSDVDVAEVLKPSLEYLDINLGHTYTNILLISDQVRDYQTIVDSTNANTFPIVYSPNSSKPEILTLLQTYFTTIDRIGVCFTSTLGTPEELFLDNKPFLRVIKNIIRTPIIDSDLSGNTNVISNNSYQEDVLISNSSMNMDISMNMNMRQPVKSTITYTMPVINLNTISHGYLKSTTTDLSLNSTTDLSLNSTTDLSLNCLLYTSDAADE